MNPPRKAVQTLKQQLVAQATALGLSPLAALQCANLSLRGWPDPGEVEQPERDFFVAYAAARARAGAFGAQVQHLGTSMGVAATARPGGVKSLERLVEKYTLSLTLPLDLLGGKVVVGSLRELYGVAERLDEFFPVVAYKDRILSPQKSGYRDVQFIVAVEGTGLPHYAEIKVMHRVFDELDVHEHKLYEIRRSLEAQQKERRARGQVGELLTPVERLVYEQVGQGSRDLYAGAWVLVQAQEQP